MYSKFGLRPNWAIRTRAKDPRRWAQNDCHRAERSETPTKQAASGLLVGHGLCSARGLAYVRRFVLS